MAGPMLPLVFGTLFVVSSVLLIALSFATDHWQETIVNRKELQELSKSNTGLVPKLESNPLYFTRYRGMFRTCYPGNETKFLDSISNKVDNCIPEAGYQLERDPATLSYGQDYDIRMHLMRTHFAFFIVAMLLLVIASIMGAIGCWKMDPKVLKATGLISFFGAFFALGGMAFFHGYDYIENAKLDGIPNTFPAYWATAAEHFTLRSHYYVQYGYSYMLGWIGVGMAAISAILFLCSAMSAADIEGDDQSPLNMKERNKAYDYMGNQSVLGSQQMARPQQPMIMAPQQQAVQQPQVQYADYGQMQQQMMQQQMQQQQMQQQPQAAYMPQYAPSNLGYDYGTGAYGRY